MEKKDFSILIKAYKLNDKDKILSGAKILLDELTLPSRLQLYEENLLVSKSTWESLQDFDEFVNINICKTIEKDICTSPILYNGDGITKNVVIENNRKFKIFPFIKLSKANT